MINIALFGPPGVGKGTQSKYLLEKYGLIYISTGDMLRKEISEQTEIGSKVKDIIDAGGLVDDEYIVKLIKDVIKTNKDCNGFLFDGFPRTYVQAYILDGLLQKMHTKLTCMIKLEAPNEVLRQRLLDRASKQNRVDDTVEVIRVRLEEYDKKTTPVASYYNEKGICYPVDGIGSIEGVSARVEERVEESIKKTLLNVVVYGYPGAGKGTQCKRLAKHFNLVYISIGRILLEEIEKESELGKRANEYIRNGVLVPDEIVIQIIEDRIRVNPNARGFVFKGFPRTIIQTYIMESFMKRMHSSISAIVNLNTSSLNCVKRLYDRGKTSDGRSYDEDLDFVIKRVKEYERKTLPVLEEYRKQYNIIDIDGTQDRDKITELMLAGVDKAYRRN
ncbi:MAG: adenylate kinase [Candidatus Cloacimonetes bacterium]|nr:adenylate kinase [Candidatus Cloacimonadota bacterium]